MRFSALALSAFAFALVSAETSVVRAWPTIAVTTTAPTAPKTTLSLRKTTATPLPTGTTYTFTTARLTTTSLVKVPSLSTSPTSSDAASSVDITGSYAVSGAGSDGSKYTGTFTVSRIGGDMYSGVWKIGGNTFWGNCFRDHAQLSCGWAVKAQNANVLAYVVGSDLLDGAWFGSGDTKLGKEQLKLASGGVLAADLSGSYTITSGVNPDGSKYSGSATITAVPAVCPTCSSISWTIGGSKIAGAGIRLKTATGDVLAAGFADGGGDFGALAYAIGFTSDGKKKPSGGWIQSVSGQLSSGNEAATAQ